ncbi:MAG TPA: 2-oxoacid:acceptor oxidoreductase family protein [Dongiaceae bacterium]|jgi:pyruvate ferredoxin oxidoreductase gamma subunit|nr:2-oxoacid:acceptor oxidoreductase family protein [Dongiaceae bacterium]
MFQVRIHGRGGQGVVTAAEMLSIAAFREGRYAQAFPSFGSERTGAPVMAFCRIDDKEIRVREPVVEPDCLIVQDPTLLHQVDLFQGLRPNGYVLINSSRDAAQLGLGALAARIPHRHLLTVPASELALKHVGRPLPNAALLGGLAAFAGLVHLKSIAEAIAEKFSGAVAASNIAAAEAAHDWVVAEISNGAEKEAAQC